VTQTDCGEFIALQQASSKISLRSRLGGWDIAETLIPGMHFGNIEYFVRKAQWGPLQEYVEERLERLVAAKVDLVVCVPNTLHRFLPPLMERHSLPFLHIADPTAEAIRARGLSRVARSVEIANSGPSTFFRLRLIKPADN